MGTFCLAGRSGTSREGIGSGTVPRSCLLAGGEVLSADVSFFYRIERAGTDAKVPYDVG